MINVSMNALYTRGLYYSLILFSIPSSTLYIVLHIVHVINIFFLRYKAPKKGINSAVDSDGVVLFTCAN